MPTAETKKECLSSFLCYKLKNGNPCQCVVEALAVTCTRVQMEKDAPCKLCAIHLLGANGKTGSQTIVPPFLSPHHHALATSPPSHGQPPSHQQ